ncbi:hypothetical protein [Bdellovibrio sp. HCB209]
MEQKVSENAPPTPKTNDARGIILLGVFVVLLIIFKVFVYPHFE